MQNIKFVDVIKNIKEHNPNSPEIHDYRKLIAGDFGSGKSNSLFNLIIHQPDIDNIYMLKILIRQNTDF